MKRHRKNVILFPGYQGPFSMGCTLLSQPERDKVAFMVAVWLAKCHVKKNPSHGDEDHMFALFKMKKSLFSITFPHRNISCFELTDCSSRRAIRS